jgi:hypothetical protein
MPADDVQPLEDNSLTDEETQLYFAQEHFIYLRAEGKTLRECVFILQKPLSTLGDWNLKFKDVIHAFRQEETAAKLGLQKSERLAKLNTIMDKLYATVEDASFNFMSTQSAFNLYMRLFAMQDHLINQ